jgi:signal transduction histidine kinase/DNA-binding LacI/PurR family transcriptional regulator
MRHEEGTSRDELTIGFLGDTLLSRYQVRLFEGVRRAAGRAGARVVGFQGSVSGRSVRGTAFDGSFLFRLPTPEAFDGLIVASNLLSAALGFADVQTLFARHALPIVSLGDLPECSKVVVDSLPGLSAVVSHLVTVHGCRRIAFIAGSPDNPETHERERVVKDTLANLGVRLDAEWVLPGNFLEASGARAVRILFDERGVNPADVDAIIACNDQMAVGASRELRARRLQVPQDIAVVGFDDDEHASNNNPPLTTVAQPVEHIGELATQMLLRRIAGDSHQSRLVIPTEARYRTSCGCKERQSPSTIHAEPASSLRDALVVAEAACRSRISLAGGSKTESEWLGTVLRVLLARDDDSSANELRELASTIFESICRGAEAVRWPDALAPLYDALDQFAEQEPNLVATCRLRLLEARGVAGESAARAQTLRSLHAIQLANALRVVGSALAGARSRKALARVVEAALPGLGVRYCWVCEFVEGTENRRITVVAHYESPAPEVGDPPQDAAALWEMLPASLPPGVRFSPNDRGVAIPSSTLLRPAMASMMLAPDLLVYPLVFADRALGYVVFDSPSDLALAWVLENVAGHLSSGLYTLAKADELRLAREVAEEANRAKTEFLAAMSDEIQRPLTAIAQQLELCMTTELDRRQREYLTRARDSSQALRDVLDDILDFSKLEARRLELETVSFELEELLEHVADTHTTDAAKKGLKLVIDSDPDLPGSLLGDPLRLSQVLSNLVSNGIKFSASGEILLRVIRATGSDGERPVLQFSVRDTGIGMTLEQLGRVFGPFTHPNRSTTRRHGETWLGLSICKSLVAMMGGELTVRSAPGAGNVFTFTAAFGRAPASDNRSPRRD